MYIIIEDDVFENLEQIDDAFDPRIMAIDHLFDAMIKGKHIVYSDIKNLIKIKNIEKLGARTRQYVGWIIKEYAQIYSCKSIITKYLSVSTKYKKISEKEDYFEVPLEYVLDIGETKLLTENESDAKFYQQLSKYRYKQKQLNGIFDVCFENDSYHGANGVSKIEQLAEGNKIVLCVADTDMDFPGDAKKSTFKGVNGAIKKAKQRIATDLLDFPVREKENLFPAMVYSKFTDVPIIRVISEKYPEDEAINNFFDIKDGIKYKKVLNPQEKWKKYYNALMSDCEKENICNKNLGEDDGDKCYISGIGEKICDNVAEVLFTGNIKQTREAFNMNDEEATSICGKRYELLSEMPDFVKENWKVIAKSLFNWGCCINISRYPAQRNW